MSAWLDRVDKLFGGAERVQDGVTRALGLKRARTSWTGEFFDMCALLAVLYPIANLVGTWIFVGDAGPIGESLGSCKGIDG
jgi:hypothetical protein